MKKLLRYSWMDIGGMSTKGRDDARWCAADDVSALEAENEMLGRQFSKLSQKLADYTPILIPTFPAFENGKETGYWDAHEQIEAILNREQEKQP